MEAYLEEWREYDKLPNLRNIFTAIERIRSFFFAVGDSIWLQELLDAAGRDYSGFSSDGVTIDSRQYYLHKVLVRMSENAS